jgi:hypothetical protein
MSNISDFLRRLAVILSIQLLIAAIHIFRLGSHLQGGLYNFYYSYFSDFILPFGFYFLLCASELQMPILRGWEPLLPLPEFLSKNKSRLQMPILRRWEAKLAIAFLIPSIAETCQYFGIPVLGATFDLLDYFMYGIGALSAVVVDTQVFSRVFDFWTREKAER